MGKKKEVEIELNRRRKGKSVRTIKREHSLNCRRGKPFNFYSFWKDIVRICMYMKYIFGQNDYQTIVWGSATIKSTAEHASVHLNVIYVCPCRG